MPVDIARSFHLVLLGDMPSRLLTEASETAAVSASAMHPFWDPDPNPTIIIAVQDAESPTDFYQRERSRQETILSHHWMKATSLRLMGIDFLSEARRQLGDVRHDPALPDATRRRPGMVAPAGKNE